MRRHLEKVTVILISANLKRIRSISRHQSNFSDSSLHLLQSFKVCLDTTRGYSLTLTKQDQRIWRPQSREMLWMWGRSFGHGEAAQSSPSRILHKKPTVEWLGMPPWAGQAAGKPKSCFCKSTRSVAGGSLD